MNTRYFLVWLMVLLACGFAAAAGDGTSSAEDEKSTAAGGDGTSEVKDEQTPVEPAHPNHKVPANIAEQATDPSAILTQLGFFYWNSVDEDGESDGSTLLFQPVLPLSKTNVLRPALPFVSTPSPDRVAGMGDLFLLDAFFFQIPNASIGVGPVASLPIATDDKLGTGKFSLGFDFMFIYKGIKKTILGFMFYPQWSISGDDNRSDVRDLTWQIICVKHFKWGYIGWTEQTGVVNFEDDNNWTLPMGFRIGKVFAAKGGKTLINAEVESYYTYNSGHGDVYGLKFAVTIIKPKWMRH